MVSVRLRHPPRSAAAWAWWLARLAVAGLVAGRVARAARRRPPLEVDRATTASGIVSVVIPARDEAGRLRPLLEALSGDPTAAEVIVVDDQSSDGTAALAAELGATVVSGTVPPDGWVGKPWALHQGLRAARGEWIVTLDADVVPERGLPGALVQRASADALDLITVAGRFDCPTPALRWLHPSLLTTLVYRFGPPGAMRGVRASRALANGQCMTFRRRPLLGFGGFGLAARHLTDDVALVRSLSARGWRTAILDGTAVLRVRMHETAREAWREWGRSLPMADVTTPAVQLGDLATLLLTQALPLPRLLLGRGDVIDVVLLALRLGTLVGTGRAYARTDVWYWLSPLADPAAVARVAWGAVRPARSWRGRTYPV